MTASRHFIREITTGTGTGNLTLAGAAAGFQSFGDAYGATTSDLLIQLYRPGGAWEVGLYTYNHGSRLIDRSSGFLTSSTGSKIDWTEGSTIVEPVVAPHDHDHGDLGGLGDDDHPQYHNDARGDARYLKLDASNDPVTEALEIDNDANADPATSGTTQSGIILRLQGAGLTVLDIGQNASSGRVWLQGTVATDLSSVRRLLLNPNGGQVGVKKLVPVADFHVGGTAEVDSDCNVAGDLTEDGNRVIACETDGKFTVPLFSDALPRGFTQVTGWDGAAVRIEDTLVDAEDGDVSAGRKDIGAAAPTTEGHTLAASEMPGHTHSTPAHSHSIPNHTHKLSYWDSTGGASPAVGTFAEAKTSVHGDGEVTTKSGGPGSTATDGSGTTGSAGGNNPHSHEVKLKYANFILAAFTGA